MKKLFIASLFCCTALFALAQKAETKPFKFDKADFNKKLAIAKWLHQYDDFAWLTSDSAAAEHPDLYKRLGDEWFCYMDNRNIWHGVYGDYENGKYDFVFHYQGNSKKIKQTPFPADTNLLSKYGKAIHISHIEFDEKIKPEAGKIHFNHYIKRNPDKTFTVWYLPAYQTNETAVYGGEYVYTVDSTGNNIISNENIFLGHFTSILIDKHTSNITLDYSTIDKPTIGSIFFAWAYRQSFPGITIKNTTSMSGLNLISSGKTESYVWEHFPVVEEDKSKKKK